MSSFVTLRLTFFVYVCVHDVCVWAREPRHTHVDQKTASVTPSLSTFQWIPRIRLCSLSAHGKHFPLRPLISPHLTFFKTVSHLTYNLSAQRDWLTSKPPGVLLCLNPHRRHTRRLGMGLGFLMLAWQTLLTGASLRSLPYQWMNECVTATPGNPVSHSQLFVTYNTPEELGD